MSQEDIYAANNTNKSMERNGIIVSKVKSVQNNDLLALLGMSIKENLC